MTWRRYLVLMGLTWAVAAALVSAVNLVVDPMGVSPIGVAIAGFNDQKPLRYQFDGLVKRLDVRRRQPATIFMGSSRIKQTIDPQSVSDRPFAPAYNAGLDGVVNFREQGTYLRYYLEHDPKLRYVFIEVFPSAQLSSSGSSLMARLPLGDDIVDYASMVFSIDALAYSARTVSLNRAHANAPAVRETADGYAPITLSTHHFSVRNVLNFVTYMRPVRRGQSLPLDALPAVRAILDGCHAHRVECRFFLSPLHADALFAMYYLGLWPELEKLKRGLAALGPTYDFTRYGDLIDERNGPVVYWPEAFHFSPSLGDVLVQVMTGSRPAGVPGNFGAVFDTNNVEASLMAWRDERDRWITEHPDTPVRMRQAEEQFAHGVPFSVVTQAEMAAGGW